MTRAVLLSVSTCYHCQPLFERHTQLTTPTGISSIDSPLLIDEDYVEPSPPPVDDESDDTGSDFTDEVQNWYVYSEDEDENEEEAKQKDDKQVAAQKKKAAGDGSGAGEQEWHDDDCNCKTCKKDLQDDAQFDWPSSVPAAP